VPTAAADRLPPPADPAVGRDPIAEAENAARAIDPLPPPVVVVPRLAPYSGPVLVRPPYVYYVPPSGRLYDPYGVVPPFVRRILNRVLP
jgi:hypothetical protein